MIILKINVKKLDKNYFYVGDKGTYCELILMENRDGEDQYGNSHFVCQGVSKEDRENGIKGPIVGNAKTFGKKPGRREERPKRQSADDKYLDRDISEIPF